MKKQIINKAVSVLGASAIIASCTSLTVNADSLEKYHPNQAAQSILESTCNELGLSASQIRSMSETDRNTLYYAYVNTSGLSSNKEYELDYYVRYDTSILSLQGAIIGPIVDESGSSFVLTGNYWKKTSGEILLDTSSTTSGTVCILAFTSVLGTNSAGTVNNGVNSRTCIYNPVIEELRRNNQIVFGFNSYFSVGIYAPGDLTNDGLINSDDTDILSGFIAEAPNCGWSSSMSSSADVNRDGLINSSDISLILQYQAGLIDSFEDYSNLI